MSDRETRAFVDALETESDSARLLVGEEAFVVPRTVLPADAFEGSWIRIVMTLIPRPPEDDTDERRRRLGADDPGGDIKL
jgi:hypothetical protein